jgi:hypothetical protein
VSLLYLTKRQPVGGHSSVRPQRGFALLITITLLAFLVLLLVSLASLTRVETQVAANNQSLAQARQNALLAMNMAVGQLQKYAGSDARITARAEITSTGVVANPNYTGVWSAAGASAGADMWLVSGSEVQGATAAGVLAAGLDPSVDAVTDDGLFLVGNQSVAVNPANPTAAEKARRIKLTKQDIYAPAGMTPGLDSTAAPRTGRYAWWVGDQGVKASLALPDRVDEVTYAPWDTVVQRRRIRQQIASMPNYFRASTATTTYAKEGFDPLTVGTTLKNVQTDGQLGLVTPVAGSMPAFVRGRFHDFTTTAHAVLANTRTDAHAGLMRDLSLKPDELGDAFKAYADYGSYMETPGTTLSGADAAYPSIDDADSPRRRYKIVAPVSSTSADPVPGLTFSASPVIAEMIIQFSVQYSAGYQVGTKAYVGMWNPYTSAFVPDNDLCISVTGLPSITIFNNAGTSSAALDLQAQLPSAIKDSSSGAMRFYLPFIAGASADTKSWFPGRIYGWTTKSSSDGVIDDRLKFYNKNLGSVQRWYYPTGPLAGGSVGIGVTVPPVSGLTVELSNAQGLLAKYTLPAFSGFTIPASTGTRWFAFAVRLKQPWRGDGDRKWLRQYDPHDVVFPASVWTGFDPLLDFNPPLDPSVYTTSNPDTALPGSLLYRIQGSGTTARSSYNDSPLFGLPRLPPLSMGELQHLTVSGSRAYFIGNSWGGAANAVFDRFFFSGLPASGSANVPNLSSGQPLPNWNTRVLDGADVATLQGAAALSSRYLLQAGGFNVNSTSAAAWRAVLSGVRFADAFPTAEIETSNNDVLGTQKTVGAIIEEKFDADSSLGTGVMGPVFLRFSQSAQETFFWKPVTSAATDSRQFSTHAFRLGVRGSNDQTAATSPVDASITAQRLTTDQIESLATEIVRLLKIRAAASGPFRTLEEFLSPQAGANTPSLLEAAIDAAGLNPDEIKPLENVPLSGGVYGAGLSSLTLTQADILTALAPYLRARSDTFMIRTYGETLNPVTAEVTGKAWLEATVQRFPETVESGDDIEKPAGAFGRRFKIISFRWLSPSDI